MWRQIQYRLCSCAEFSQAGGQVLCTLPKLHGCRLIRHSRHRRLRWRNHLTSRLENKHGIRHFSNQRALLKKSDVISERIDGYLKEVLTGNDEGKLGTTILWLTLAAPHSLHQLRNVVSYSLKHMNTENINSYKHNRMTIITTTCLEIKKNKKILYKPCSFEQVAGGQQCSCLRLLHSGMPQWFELQQQQLV